MTTLKVNQHTRRISLLTAAVACTLLGSLAACNKTNDTTATTDSSSGTTYSAASSAVSTTGTTLGKEVDDSITTARVKSALMADDEIKSMDVNVETRHGEVVLSGFADNEAQISRAVSVAGHTEGVTTVSNKLSLKDGKQTVGNKIDDTVITASVKAALMGDSSLKSREISVVTRKGEVQLTGFVDTDAQISHAADVAKTVDGVGSVINNLVVKK